MIDRTKQEKLNRFMHDENMNQAVYKVMLDAFLSPHRSHDVQSLAASRMAIDLLNEAWKDLEQYKNNPQSVANTPLQPGL